MQCIGHGLPHQTLVRGRAFWKLRLWGGGLRLRGRRPRLDLTRLLKAHDASCIFPFFHFLRCLRAIKHERWILCALRGDHETGDANEDVDDEEEDARVEG